MHRVFALQTGTHEIKFRFIFIIFLIVISLRRSRRGSRALKLFSTFPCDANKCRQTPYFHSRSAGAHLLQVMMSVYTNRFNTADL